MHGQLVEWLGLPPPRNPRPQSAQARTPGVRPGRDLFANDGGSPGHRGLGFRGSEGTLLTATTMVSELQRVNETLLEEHTALQQHVGSLEGEMTAMRADLQALRIDLSRGVDDRILGKIGNKAGGRTNDEPAGTVTVRVLRATGLVAADKGGTSDPYVVVQTAGGKKTKTSVKKKTLDPEWDETLELSVLDAAAPLSFTVWDHDKVGTNDSLGAGEILLGQCAPGAPTSLRVALSTQGAIEVVVTFLPAEPAVEPEELTAASSSVAGAAAGAGARAPVSGARAARAAAIAREAATPQVVPAVASGAAQRDRGAPLGDTASRLKRLVTGGGGSSAGQAAASSPADSDGLARAV